MFPVTNGQLNLMQTTQEHAMRDQCDLLEPSETAGRYGKPIITYAVVATSVCGLNQFGSQSREVLDTTAVPIANPTLRLPIGTSIRPNWRVRITHRNGQPIAPLVFDVIGEPSTVGTAFVVNVATTTLGGA